MKKNRKGNCYLVSSKYFFKFEYTWFIRISYKSDLTLVTLKRFWPIWTLNISTQIALTPNSCARFCLSHTIWTWIFLILLTLDFLSILSLLILIKKYSYKKKGYSKDRDLLSKIFANRTNGHQPCSLYSSKVDLLKVNVTLSETCWILNLKASKSIKLFGSVCADQEVELMQL